MDNSTLQQQQQQPQQPDSMRTESPLTPSSSSTNSPTTMVTTPVDQGAAVPPTSTSSPTASAGAVEQLDGTRVSSVPASPPASSPVTNNDVYSNVTVTNSDKGDGGGGGEGRGDDDDGSEEASDEIDVPVFRFYRNELPVEGEITTVRIEEVNDYGYTCSLLEYGGLEAALIMAEVSAQRLRKGKKYFRSGRVVEVLIQRVDAVRGYVDVSRKRVDGPEINACRERFVQGRMVASILARVSVSTGVSFESLYETVAWPLADSHGSSYEGFIEIRKNPAETLEPLGLDANVEAVLRTEIERRLALPMFAMRANVEVMCHSSEGVIAIRRALRAGQSVAPDVVITTVASPEYALDVKTRSEEKGAALLLEAVEAIREKMVDIGSVRLSQPPHAVRGV